MKATHNLCLAMAIVAAVCCSAVAAPPPALDCTDNRGTIITADLSIEGGTIAFGGATLLVDFFRQQSSTFDYIDADGDAFAGFNPLLPPFLQQLAEGTNSSSPYLDTYWLFTYRSVGSVNGLNEFIDNQLLATFPDGRPSEAGIFNRYEYVTDGNYNGPPSGWPYIPANASGIPLLPCQIDGAFMDVPGAWGVVGNPGDAAWSRNPLADGYGRNFTKSSDGFVSKLASLEREGGFALNQNYASPDDKTIYDYTTVWVPVAVLGNRGVGKERITYTEAQYLWVTGRLPNGENIVAAARDVGSGTRNAHNNSFGIDPSWGRGENLGRKTKDSNTDFLGPKHQPSNRGGSSRMEGAVQNNRLALGYTGLGGSSRAGRDAAQGKYEVLSVCQDLNDCTCTGTCSASGNPCLADCDCPTGEWCDFANADFVHPSVNTVLDNCGCDGYQIAGSGSFITQGDIYANVGDPDEVKNEAARDYLLNLFAQIQSYERLEDECLAGICDTSLTDCIADEDCPAGEECIQLTCGNDADCQDPGDDHPDEWNVGPCDLGTNTCVVNGATCTSDADCFIDNYCKGNFGSPLPAWFLHASLDCQHEVGDPTSFIPSSSAPSGFSQALQDVTRADNGLGWGALPDGSDYYYGQQSPAGRVPTRDDTAGPYSDGQTAAYAYQCSGTWKQIEGGNDLSAANAIQGNFNSDGLRNVDDAAGLVNAYLAPRAWQMTAPAVGGGDIGEMDCDNKIPEVLGDFNGDGNLTKEDLRYFADGLALTVECPIELDRKAGAIAIDTALAAAGVDYPWADTRDSLVVPPAVQYDNPTFETPAPIGDFVATGTYDDGDFRCDIAGRATPTFCEGDGSPCGSDDDCLGACSISGDPCSADDECLGTCSVTTGTTCSVDEDCPDGETCENFGGTCEDYEGVCQEGIMPVPGAQPLGWDGKCDAADIDYVCANIADWSNLDEAVFMDLSADMDGDVDVDYDDVKEIVENILDTQLGDFNLDGAADQADRDIAQATIDAGAAGCNGDETCGWTDGDCNCDGIVDETDLECVGFFYPECEPASTAACPNMDVNCDNEVNGFDIADVRNTANWNLAPEAAANARADTNRDGSINGFDIADIRNTACWNQ